MKKISYLVLCGALLGGAMESWGANNVNFGFAQQQGARGVTNRVARNVISCAGVDVGFINTATSAIIGDSQDLYDAMYPGGNVVDGGGEAAQANWFIRNTPVGLCNGAAVLTEKDVQFLMKDCLGAVFTSVGLRDYIVDAINVMVRVGFDEMEGRVTGVGPFEFCIPANAGGLRGARDERAMRFAECFEYFDQDALRNVIVSAVRRYLTVIGFGIEYFDEAALMRALANVEFGVI